MSETVTATAYLVIQAERYTFGTTNSETGLKEVSNAKVMASRQGRPNSLSKDQVLVKVRVQLPKVVFDPIMPEALIVVDESMILDRGEIEVQAIEPFKEDA